jgi:hypothetical protein
MVHVRWAVYTDVPQKKLPSAGFLSVGYGLGGVTKAFCDGFGRGVDGGTTCTPLKGLGVGSFVGSWVGSFVYGEWIEVWLSFSFKS